MLIEALYSHMLKHYLLDIGTLDHTRPPTNSSPQGFSRQKTQSPSKLMRLTEFIESIQVRFPSPPSKTCYRASSVVQLAGVDIGKTSVLPQI